MGVGFVAATKMAATQDFAAGTTTDTNLITSASHLVTPTLQFIASVLSLNGGDRVVVVVDNQIFPMVAALTSPSHSMFTLSSPQLPTTQTQCHSYAIQVLTSSGQLRSTYPSSGLLQTDGFNSCTSGYSAPSNVVSPSDPVTLTAILSAPPPSAPVIMVVPVSVPATTAKNLAAPSGGLKADSSNSLLESFLLDAAAGSPQLVADVQSVESQLKQNFRPRRNVPV